VGWTWGPDSRGPLVRRCGFSAVDSASISSPAPQPANALTVAGADGKELASIYNSAATGEPVFCVLADVPAYDLTCASDIAYFNPDQQQIIRSLQQTGNGPLAVGWLSSGTTPGWKADSIKAFDEAHAHGVGDRAGGGDHQLRNSSA
jgi:hypothetical protein